MTVSRIVLKSRMVSTWICGIITESFINRVSGVFNSGCRASSRFRRCWGLQLAMSYFEHYYNLRKEKTLRRYSRPVNLRRFDSIRWMTAEEDVWAVPEYLTTIAHTPLLTRRIIQRLGRVDDRLFTAGLVGRASR